VIAAEDTRRAHKLLAHFNVRLIRIEEGL